MAAQLPPESVNPLLQRVHVALPLVHVWLAQLGRLAHAARGRVGGAPGSSMFGGPPLQGWQQTGEQTTVAGIRGQVQGTWGERPMRWPLDSA